ncbi:MAG: hypothetical protein GX804_11940, partial [Lentisphaerae bacterium]|nr:hypothetical protein [Lentisphaerota bacterium]
VIYLASDVGGCFRTIDGGDTWKMIHGGLPPGEGTTQIRGILAHPDECETFLVAAGSAWDKSHGIYRSDDGGQTYYLTLKGRFEGNDWTRAEGTILVADPDNPVSVYAAPIGTGIFFSPDFGKTWQSLGFTGSYPRDLVIDRSNSQRIWVNAAARSGKDTVEVNGKKIAIDKHGLFVTHNAGKSWESLGDESPIEMVQDPKDAALLHAAFRNVPALRYSRDYGKTWQAYDNAHIFPKPGDARSDGTYAALAAGPDFIIAAGHGGTFYRLPCGSLNWEKLPPPAINEGSWYAGINSGVERHFGSALGFIGISPDNPDHWLFTDWYACYQTTDAGKTWNLTIDGIEMTVLHCVAQDPANPLRVHAGMADIGYFRSDDGGETFPLWGRHLGISSNIKHISVCASKSSRVYAVGPIRWQWHANQTFRSDDGGSSWVRPAQRGLPNLADDGGERCNTICVNPANPDEVWLVVSGTVKPGGGGVYRSDNGGDDWKWYSENLPETPLFRKDIWVSGPELAVSANGAAVAMSNDSGRGFVLDPATGRWNELGSLPGWSNCVIADPLSPDRFYAALREAGLFRSDDGGRNWENIYTGPAYAVAADAAVSNRIAVTDGIKYLISDNAGKEWKKINGAPPYRHRRNTICFAGNRLICGTGGSGCFWTDLNEVNDSPLPISGKTAFGLKLNTAGSSEGTDKKQTSDSKDELIKNGYMEEGENVPAHWNLQGGANERKQWARDITEYATAPASLRIDVASGAAFAQQRLAGNPGGKTLEWNAAVKIKGEFKHTQIIMQCFDPSWKQIDWKILGNFQKNDVWEKLSNRVSLPENAYHVMFGLLVEGTGSAWLDDVSVSEFKPAAADDGTVKSQTTPAILPQIVAPDDQRLHFNGRWDWNDKSAARAAWSASSVKIRFRGSNLDARISSSDRDAIQVFIDGEDRGAFFLKDRKVHRVASGLSDSEHTVELIKRTEPIWGTIRFEGFALDKNAVVLQAEPRQHLLLAIGDSVTTAYGNEAPGKESKFSPLTQNGAESHAAYAARTLGADYECIAWSGRKMSPDNTIGEIWQYTLPREKINADFKVMRQPDAVVIGFSGNDFSGGAPNEEQWTEAYAAFIDALRNDLAPAARIYLFASPMTWGDENRAVIRRYLEKVIGLRRQTGDEHVVFLDYPMQNISADGVGADWHPSTATHRKLGNILVEALKKDLGWKPAR